MINKIFYGRSLFKSKTFKGFFRKIEDNKLFPQDTKYELIELNNQLTVDPDTVVCFRSTDQLFYKRLVEDDPIKNTPGYIAFNQHLPWFFTNYLSPEHHNYHFIFYFDEAITDIVYKKDNQFIQIAGSLDYGFYLAYHKLSLYLELHNEKQFLQSIQNEELGHSSKMRQISLLSKITSIDQLGLEDEQRVVNFQNENFCFQIEPFMQEQRSKLFLEQKTKVFKQKLSQDVSFQTKQEVAFNFEKLIYRQIYDKMLSIREQFNKKHPNEQCVILLCGKLTYNKYFRQMVKQICDKLNIKIILHEQKYHNIIPYFINQCYTFKDIQQNPQNISTFMNVSYGVHRPFQQVL
ncbi:hypothetical protein TTHERM_00124060 (macronuclear) [Tetrahymena thermophila SB210]|uniref:Uncharacterized protein n=1 Tax=Tetrahymena thermophila (strain SB210) TaxID=312017 RepID=Q22YL5_TETTS|nr:hypothetical protein TTHERM_00124060 [Tetrahymena thermophila SB210]EAR90656.1 hypothetical protein TTHERM_00124060 [Tetrahymena thermophila SB210]|eukprot:XP_001010901.1 hypothetical protein TTHERM_00124060 [Tetrahymena thermophila SB210]